VICFEHFLPVNAAARTLKLMAGWELVVSVAGKTDNAVEVVVAVIVVATSAIAVLTTAPPYRDCVSTNN